MLKILTIHGSPHKGKTYEITMEFLKELQNRIEIEVIHTFLFQEHLELCQGCGNCIVFGEERCPNKDGLLQIHAMMQSADAVIITTPVYALQVSALVKNLLERSAYIMHRPCYFGKWFMSISTQAYSGDKDVAKYLASVMQFCGFNIIPGLRLTVAPGNETEAQKEMIKKKINAAVKQFQAIEKKEKFPVPTWKELMMFRLRRSVINSKNYTDVFPRDGNYFLENDWLNTVYYYDVHLNPLKKIAGRFFDALGRKMINNEGRQDINNNISIIKFEK
ncbi:MAG: flavodoxin family protein [Promethearchaeota archaeon]